MGNIFRFPNPVNELAARSVAGGVVILTALTLASSLAFGSGWLWLSVPLAFGFVARVASGPKFSPLGQFATRVVAPRLGPSRPTAGPPKRFAQAIGASLSVAAVLAHFAFGTDWFAQLCLGAILVAAILEAGFGICLGCVIFGRLMKAGLVPAQTCAACADISLSRVPAA